MIDTFINVWEISFLAKMFNYNDIESCIITEHAECSAILGI